MSIVAGGNDFIDMIRLLGNQPELERRLTALNDAKAKAEETIALAGKASEILSLREQINADANAMKQALERAQVQAGVIVADGRKRAEEIIAEANTLLEQQKEVSAATSKQAGEILATARAEATDAIGMRREAQALMAEAQNLKIKAEQDSVMAKETIAAFNAKLAALRDTQDQFIEALGLL